MTISSRVQSGVTKTKAQSYKCNIDRFILVPYLHRVKKGTSKKIITSVKGGGVRGGKVKAPVFHGFLVLVPARWVGF